MEQREAAAGRLRSSSCGLSSILRLHIGYCLTLGLGTRSDYATRSTPLPSNCSVSPGRRDKHSVTVSTTLCDGAEGMIRSWSSGHGLSLAEEFGSDDISAPPGPTESDPGGGASQQSEFNMSSGRLCRRLAWRSRGVGHRDRSGWTFRSSSRGSEMEGRVGEIWGRRTGSECIGVGTHKL